MQRAILCLCALAATAGAADSLQLTEDELLFMNVPTVVTASRKPQPINEAPASVFVITADDIKQSGATSIPDVLRMAPGLDVMTMSVRNQSVNARGMGDNPYSSKMLIMVDGRAVTWDVYGAMLWEGLPITMGEISRIEVILSPASSLYGSNAFSGVINIITKTPNELNGTTVRLTGGEYSTVIGSATYGRAGKRLSLKASAEVSMADEWRGDHAHAGTLEKGNGLLRYNFRPNLSASLSAGRTHVNDMKFFADEMVGSLGLNGNMDYAQLEGNWRGLSLRTFLRREDCTVTLLRTGQNVAWTSMTIDADLQHTLPLGRWMNLLWGANYRANTLSRNAVLANARTEHLGGVFAEDEVRLGTKLRLNLGARYDWHPVSGSHISPRGGIVWMPLPTQTLRLNAGSAFRNPTFIDSYLKMETARTVDLSDLNLPLPMDSATVLVSLAGKEKLRAERVTSVELSHAAEWLRGRLSSSAGVYVRHWDHRYQTFDTTVYPATGPYDAVLTAAMKANGQANGVGGELALSAKPFDWLRVWANYAYQQMLITTDKQGNTLDQAARLWTNPANKVNAGLQVSIAGFQLAMSLYWRDKTAWNIPDGSYALDLNTFQLQRNLNHVSLPATTVVNARVAYAYKSAEIAIAVFDLFDRWYYEYPPGVNLPDASSDELHQKVTVTLTCTF